MNPHTDFWRPALTRVNVERLYLSGQISGVPCLNRPAFTDAQTALESVGFTVANPFDVTQSTDWATCMRADIKAMMDCDGVAVLVGWENSRGAAIEVGLAIQLGIPVAAWQTWVKERDIRECQRPL